MKKIDNLCCTNKLATTGHLSASYQQAIDSSRSDQSNVNTQASAEWQFCAHHLRSLDKSARDQRVLNTTSKKVQPPPSKSRLVKKEDVNSTLNSLSDCEQSEVKTKDLKIGSKHYSHLHNFNRRQYEPNDRVQILSCASSKMSELFSLVFSYVLLVTSSAFRQSNHHHPHQASLKNQKSSLYLKLCIIFILFKVSTGAVLNVNYSTFDTFETSFITNRPKSLNLALAKEPPSASLQVAPTTSSTTTTTSTTTKKPTTKPTTTSTTVANRPQKEENFDIYVAGFRVEGDRVEVESDQITSVYSDIPYTILLYGTHFTDYPSDSLFLSITPYGATRGADCSVSSKEVYNLTVINDNLAKSYIKFRIVDSEKSRYYYICMDYKSKSIHQGDEDWMLIHVENKLLPFWLQVFFIFILLCLAGLFSGLNLGLMALDLHELQVIESCGTPTEKRYARRIKPVRKRGNYLLCTILLGNVMVQTTLTVLLEDLTSGLVAVFGSTFSIVVFGEIVPQAICSRQGLAIGANTVFLMWFFMALTFPVSFPISWALDKVLGKEIGKIYDRDRLTEYLRITQRYNKLDSDELKIIQGALKLKKITVSEIMTQLEDIFSLPVNSVLNFNTLTMIQKSGFSRIPVFDTDRSNIVAVLFAKDLAFVDPDDKIPIQTLCQFYKHEISYIFADATCHAAFTLFKEGKSHIAFVVRVSEDVEEKDPHYEVLGLVTLEDVLEEVLQTEIVDETDVLTDNRRKKRRKEVDSRTDYADFCLLNSESEHIVSPQIVLVSYQYLSTSVPAFSKRFMSESVLRRLISQNVYHKEDPTMSCYSDVKIVKLYEQGCEYDYFILILEGYVHVSVSKEHLTFQTGPFSCFGSSTLKLKDEDNLTLESLDIQMNEPFSWEADYTVECTEKVTYLKLNRKLYISVVRQSLEQSHITLPHENNENSISKKEDNQNPFNGLKMIFNSDKKV